MRPASRISPILQRQIVRDALEAFETISRPGIIVELPYVWDANDRQWETTDYTGDFLPPRPPKEDADLVEEERRARFTNSNAK